MRYYRFLSPHGKSCSPGSSPGYPRPTGLSQLATVHDVTSTTETTSKTLQPYGLWGPNPHSTKGQYCRYTWTAWTRKRIKPFLTLLHQKLKFTAILKLFQAGSNSSFSLLTAWFGFTIWGTIYYRGATETEVFGRFPRVITWTTANKPHFVNMENLRQYLTVICSGQLSSATKRLPFYQLNQLTSSN